MTQEIGDELHTIDVNWTQYRYIMFAVGQWGRFSVANMVPSGMFSGTNSGFPITLVDVIAPCRVDFYRVSDSQIAFKTNPTINAVLGNSYPNNETVRIYGIY